MSFIKNELAWWITVVDLPALAALFSLIWRTRRDHEQTTRHLRDIIDTRSNQMREALSSFKLEVAKGYASITDMRELENRLIDHLLRIESKLDRTAMKTAALNARKDTE